MAVTSAHLTTGSSTTNASSYATASITPAANRLVLLATLVSVGASPTPTITVTGNGLTWVQVDTTVAAARTVVVFRAMGASPTAGAVTIAGTSLTSCLWSIVQFDGVDTSGTNGSGAIAQSFNSKPANTNNLSEAFPTTPAAGNGGFAGVGNAVQELPVGGAGWTTQNTSQSAPTSGLAGLHAASSPAAVTATWTTSSSPFVVGVEVAAAAAGPSAPLPVRQSVSLRPALVRASYW